MKIHPLISDTATLAALCDRLANSPFVAVDTEFMRENTYWPILCLIQIGDETEAAAVDPMADGIDLQPLLDLLVDNEDVLKVVHAGSQDIEIVHNLTGKTPHPLFDTQIAQMALSENEQIGYVQLVDDWLGEHVDKGARFTDWAQRPLTAKQLDYAVGDVTHLAAIFPKMLAKLQKTGRGAWLDDEMERLADPANYRTDPEIAWQRVKIASRKPVVLGRLKALAAWREAFAQKRDLPRGRVMKDETLGDLAMNPPRAQADLAKVRGLSAGWGTNEGGRAVMDALARAEPLPEDEMPEAERRGRGGGRQSKLVGDLLKLLLKIRSSELGVASRLIARGGDLDRLAGGNREGLELLGGWRYDVFGREAVDLVDGRVGFAVANGKLALSRLEVGGSR